MNRPAPTIVFFMLLTSSIIIASPNWTGPAQETPPAQGAIRSPIIPHFTDLNESAFSWETSENVAWWSDQLYLSWGDYDNDGYDDLLRNGRKLYRNNGNGTFTEVTAAAGINQTAEYGTWADYDNDGWQDFYACGNLHMPDYLWHNNGDGTFTEVTAQAGDLSCPALNSGASWGDYDNDGFLDLYIMHGEGWPTPDIADCYYWPNFLFHNNGDGTFTNVTTSSGMFDPSNPEHNPPVYSFDNYGNIRYSEGSSWCDYNQDGWQDLFVANYRLMPNFLWRNNGDGTFTNVAREMGVEGAYDPDRYLDSYTNQYWGPAYGHSAGVLWIDANNDGLMDLWVSNLVHKYVGLSASGGYDIRGYVCDDSALYINQGAPDFNFINERVEYGIPLKPMGGEGVYEGDELYKGATLGDYNLDGYMDMFLPQVYELEYAKPHLWLNNGNESFSEVWQEAGVNTYSTFCAATSDFNNDGYPDIVTGGHHPFMKDQKGDYDIHLFSNDGGNGKMVKVRLQGTASNSRGVGSLVTVGVGDRTTTQVVTAGSGSKGQCNSLDLIFGLGDAQKADWIEVRWPSGRGKIERHVPWDSGPVIIQEPTVVPTNIQVSADKTALSEDEEVTFSFSADGATLYQWDFEGDGAWDWEGTDSSPLAHYYPNEGTYLASLRVCGPNGTLIWAERITLEVSNTPPNPVPALPVSGFEDQNITFDASATWDTDSDLPTLEYKWVFGDGTYTQWSTDPVSHHVYTDSGEYDANLSVRDDNGAWTWKTFTVQIDNVVPSCTGSFLGIPLEEGVLNFTGTGNDSVSDLDSLVYRWDFGDGHDTDYQPTSDANHSYISSGNYTAVLYVKDDDGDVGTCNLSVFVQNRIPWANILQPLGGDSFDEDDIVTFTWEGGDTPSDSIGLQYRLDYGDGDMVNWTSSKKADHIYTTSGSYNVTLQSRDDDGDMGIAIITIRIDNIPPEALLDSDRFMVEEDEPFVLDGSYTIDTPSDQDDLNYTWLLNNEVMGWGETLELSIGSSGDYDGILRVTDNDGAVGEIPFRVEVSNTPPSADMLVETDTPKTGSVVTFRSDELADTPTDLANITVLWDFGDGSEGEGLEVQHTYDQPGKYTVVMVVSDGDLEYEHQMTIEVKGEPVDDSGDDDDGTGDDTNDNEGDDDDGQGDGDEGASGSASDDNTIIIGVVAIAAVLAVVGMLIIISRKGKKEEKMEISTGGPEPSEKDTSEGNDDPLAEDTRDGPDDDLDPGEDLPDDPPDPPGESTSDEDTPDPFREDGENPSETDHPMDGDVTDGIDDRIDGDGDELEDMDGDGDEP